MGWRDNFDRIPRFVENFELDPQPTAPVIIEMQYSNAHLDHGGGRFLKESYPKAADYYVDRLTKLVIPNKLKLLNVFGKNRMRAM